jgi:hypothetical protein
MTFKIIESEIHEKFWLRNLRQNGPGTIPGRGVSARFFYGILLKMNIIITHINNLPPERARTGQCRRELTIAACKKINQTEGICA